MSVFGTTANGHEVQAIDIATDQLSVRVLTFGAVLNDVRLKGVDYPLTLGSPDIAAYEGPLGSFGSLMGPYVNRIRDAKATIDGREYQFEKNFQGQHTLHSGADGTHCQVWEIEAQSATSVTLTLRLPDGLGGFPGNRWFRAIYRVSGSTLSLEVAAETDAPTLISLANHSYWALDPTPGFAGHTLTIPAGRYLEPDEDLMPTGRMLPVEGGAYDARAGLSLTGNADQFFDLNYCFCEGDRALHDVARLRGTSGVEMTMETTAPGLQVYDCGTIDGAGFASHHGREYGHYSGVALEAQRWPGATSHASFPRVEFGPGERFHQLTRWSFTS
ncbi:MAG: aldose epimerase family protein [Pseudomonadota bacterium]